MVCNTEAFRFLGAAARDGHCRLVLCGRGLLFKSILHSKSPLECRVDLVQLEPLKEEPAKQLILKPLDDLGFRVIERERFVNRLLRLTGQLPHLIQFCGQKIVDYLLEQQTSTVSEELVNKLEGDFVSAQYFMKPLNDLEDSVARRVGLALLNENAREFQVAFIQDLANRAGISIDPSRALEIGNDLVISNVLSWNNGSFRIANEGLLFYARRFGYLTEL
jgi:hypothetical protein